MWGMRCVLVGCVDEEEKGNAKRKVKKRTLNEHRANISMGEWAA